MNDVDSEQLASALAGLEQLAAMGDYDGRLLAIVQRLRLQLEVPAEELEWLSGVSAQVSVKYGSVRYDAADGGGLDGPLVHIDEFTPADYDEAIHAIARLRLGYLRDPKVPDLSQYERTGSTATRGQDVSVATSTLECIGAARLVQLLCDWSAAHLLARMPSQSHWGFGTTSTLERVGGWVAFTSVPIPTSNIWPVHLQRDEYDFSPFASDDDRARFRTKRNRWARANAAKYQSSFVRACFHFDRFKASLERLPAELREPGLDSRDPRLWDQRPEVKLETQVDAQYMASVMLATSTPKKKLPKHAGSKMSPEEAGAARIEKKRVKKKAAKRKRSKKR